MEDTSSNLHLRLILTELLAHCRENPDHVAVRKMVGEAAAKIERAVRDKDPLLTETEVAHRYPWLNVTKLRNMRCREQGPHYIKFGQFRNSKVYYRIADIEKWIVEHRQMPRKPTIGYRNDFSGPEEEWG